MCVSKPNKIKINILIGFACTCLPSSLPLPFIHVHLIFLILYYYYTLLPIRRHGVLFGAFNLSYNQRDWIQSIDAISRLLWKPKWTESITTRAQPHTHTHVYTFILCMIPMKIFNLYPIIQRCEPHTFHTDLNFGGNFVTESNMSVGSIAN